jgi:DNA repair exonuclease SbcCD nuclease subunit
VALASTEKVDFIVAAGDLFEDNRIAHRYVEEMARAVSACSVPVYLLPGNHDPLTQDSPYIRSPELFGGASVVLGKAEPLRVPGGTLYPCPALAKFFAEDPTGWIPRRTAEDGIRVGIAHGPLKGTPDHSCGYPIPNNAAEALDLDYLALGHWHTTRRETDRLWHCGTPEPTKFGETSGVLIVEIGGPGQAPSVRPVAVNTYDWVDFGDFEIHGEGDLRHLEAKLEAVENPLRSLVRVRLRGGAPLAVMADLEKLEGRYSPRFHFFRLENAVAPSDGAASYGNPLLKEMSELLSRQAATEGPDAEAAARAMGKLALLARECGLR